jgi:hypothetical protein
MRELMEALGAGGEGSAPLGAEEGVGEVGATVEERDAILDALAGAR